MRRALSLLFIVVASGAWAACSVDTSAPASSSSSGGSPSLPDGASAVEAGPSVGPVAPGDGGEPTDGGAGPYGEILGTLSGSCGAVKALLATSTPSFEKNALAFAANETYSKANLSPGGARLYDTPNAGGSSGESEVMSFEVLRHCEGAELVKTETEVQYAPPDDAGASSITDILVSIGGTKVGVSVTRVYKPSSQGFPDSEVKTLLKRKLEQVNRSSVRVLPADKWKKQILHVFTATKAATDAIERVLPTISAQHRADSVVLVTQTSGGGFVYCNPDPPLGSECPP